MKNNYLDFLDHLREKQVSTFLDKTKSQLKIVKSSNKVTRDSSWLDKIEECIPYIDSIVSASDKPVRNLDEKVKKEKPVSKDAYENRFIYTLLYNLRRFVNEHIERDNTDLESSYQKNVTYSGVTKLDSEVINFTLTMDIDYKPSSEEKKTIDSIKDRIDNISSVVDDMLNSKFIKSLGDLSLVRNPIKSLDIFKSDRNYVKAVELWNYIDDYDMTKSIQVVNSEKKEVNNDLMEKYDLLYYLEHYSLEHLSTEKNYKEYREKKFLPYMRKVVEEYITSNDMNEKEFKDLMYDEFKKAKKKQMIVYGEIKNDYMILANDYYERLKNALSYFE